MGDIFHIYPAISDLKLHFPDAELHWLVEDAFVGIAKWHPKVDKVIPISLRRWLKQRNSVAWNEFVSWKEELHNSSVYDLVIDAQGLMKSAIISRCANAKTIHGYDYFSVREVLASFAYKQTHLVDRNMHSIEKNRLLLASAMGYQPTGPADFGISDLFNPSENETKHLLFIIGTSKDEKLWRADRWCELAEIATNEGFSIETIWGDKKEKNLALSLKETCPHLMVAEERLSMLEVAQKIHAASGVIGLDTGFTHLSGALEVPTVALFGPTLAGRYGLIGKQTRNLSQMHDLSSEMVWLALEEKMLGRRKTMNTELG